MGKDLGEEASLLFLQALLVAQRQPSFGGQVCGGGKKTLFGGAAAELVQAQKTRARGGQLIVDPERVHPRNVLGLRSGRLRRDTWSVSHFTERLARSATTACGS